MEKRFSHAALARLARGSRDDHEQFAAAFPTLPVDERRRVARSMVQMAEDDVELDFHDFLLRFLLDEDVEVRATAADGLWEDERLSTAQRLMEIARVDPSDEVRGYAIKSLGGFAGRLALGELHPRVAEPLRELILEMAAPRLPVPIRRRAVELAGYIDADEARSAIQDAYRADDPALRASAVNAMGRACDPRYGETVLREMASDDAEMRFEAIDAMALLEDPRCIPGLLEATRDDDREVRLAAVRALGILGGRDARETLLRLARSTDEVMREAAEAALEELELLADPLGVRVTDVSLN